MAQISYGTITITDITDGANANIWTTSTAPTTPNYTFIISNLTGADDNPRVGDIILQGVYRYTITSIGSTTVLAGSRQSLQGATGTAGGRWYSGTGITGTSTTATVFSGSGVSSAVVGDMYLNTSTDNVYQCTTAGNASTAKWKYVGNIKGSTGSQGRSVTSVVTEYYRKLSGGSAPTSSTTGSTTIPDYVDGCTYYTRTITNFDSGNPDKSEWVANSGLTNEIKNAYDAWIAAGAAELKVAKIIENSEGMIVTSGINGGAVTPGTTSTYGYNTLMAPNYLGLRYNAINLAKLTTTESTPALEFYIPSANSRGTPVQGNKGLSISATALTFYNPSSNAAQLIIGANGVLQSGNYVYTSGTYSDSGTKIDLTTGSIYTPGFRTDGSNTYIRGEINALSGKIGNNSTNYWTIGNNYNYDQTASAALISHGTAFIQLDTSNTWRLSTDRIHTAWNGTDSSAALMFPKDGNTYWDWGIHSPHQTNNVWKDKFVYARKYTNTTDDDFTNRDNLSNDIDDDLGLWTYQFYIDKNGSIYARNFYLLNEDGTPGSNIGGQDSVYLLKSGGIITGNLEVNGTLTKGNKNVAYLTATPTTNQVLIADGTTGGIKTSGYTIAKSVPSGAIFTDENVKSTEANTTKLWLVGSDTSGTRTGALKYDSGVYITTTAGTLHATTFDGTATRATADSDGNTIKATYLKLSGGNVTGAVTFGSSISAASASIVDLTVTGNASFTNNISANTINGVAVGSTPRFTDSMVTQTATTTSAAYEVLFSYTADNTTRTESARKTSTLTYNPSTKELTIGTVKIKEASTGFTISGGTTSKTLTVGGDYTLAAAATKGVVTSIDTSANLPTSNAVKTFVEGKGYITANHTSTYSLPLAASGTRGGVQIGYTQSGKNYPVQLSSEKMYVNVPWTDTTYTIATGTTNGKIKITPSSGSAYEISICGWTDWLPLTGGQVTGPVTFGDSVSVDDLTVGQLIVNGNASFVNGLTTTTVNGYTPAAAMAKGVVTSIDTSANLPTSNAVKTFVENKGYVTSSGVTSVTVAATSPVVSSTGTAQSGASVSTTISLANNYGDTKNPYAAKDPNKVLAGPSSGSATAVPTFRALVAADIPNLNWSKITAGKPTTLSGYGITDAAGTNALVGLEASSNAQGVTTFTATRASGTDPLSFEVSITASSATGATKLKDSSGDISLGAADHPVYFSGGVPAQSYYIPKLNGSNQTSAASFYAPTSGGTANQVLVSQGNAAPKWVNQSSITSGNDTTYTIATGDNNGEIKVTPNPGTAYNVSVKGLGDRAFDSTTYLPLAGGTMTGTIKINNVNGIQIASVNKDIRIWEIDGDAGSWNSTYGFHELYKGSGSGNDNTLELYAHNQSGTHVKVRTIKQDGTVTWHTTQTFSNTIVGSINGNAATATKATNDSDNNPINTTYLKKSGGTMTGSITFGADSSAWNNKGILFTNGSRIGENSTGALGIYGSTKVYIRTNSASGASTTGMLLEDSTVYPSTDNTHSLGTSSNKWNTVYATTFSGNATSATKATQDGDGNVIKTTYLKLTGGNVTGATTFGSSVSINSLSVIDMTCTGSASFTNGLTGNLTGNATSATKADLTTTTNAVAYYTDAAGTFGSKASANGALYATSANGTLTFGTLPAAQGGTGKTTLKDACNALINALDTGSSNLTSNDYVITQYVGGGTTTTTYHRRPASALRVGGLLTARKLKVALGSTTDKTFDGTADVTDIPISGILGVGNGGTGTTSFTANSLIMSGSSTTAALTTRSIRNNTALGSLGWTSQANDNVIPTVNTLAYWNGRFNDSTSNLAYCNKGAFGTAATYTAATSVGNNSNLPTGAAIQTYVSGIVGNYVTLGTDQTITASQKTFNGAIRWGTDSKYGAVNYNSTLDALVFSFA